VGSAKPAAGDVARVLVVAPAESWPICRIRSSPRSLTFSDRVIYPANAVVRAGGLTALEDQATAGVIMWVPGSLVFLVAAVWLAIETLDGARAASGMAAAGAAVGAAHRAGPARPSRGRSVAAKSADGGVARALVGVSTRHAGPRAVIETAYRD
jgi:hypothetical protein